MPAGPNYIFDNISAPYSPISHMDGILFSTREDKAFMRELNEQKKEDDDQFIHIASPKSNINMSMFSDS